jgi:5-methyltetrahydropteroyltriglutamate--homocysteine methyltransferase
MKRGEHDPQPDQSESGGSWVTDPINRKIETSEGVRDRVFESAEFIPLKSFRTTDDCGFSPLADDTAFAKIVPHRRNSAGREDLGI